MLDPKAPCEVPRARMQRKNVIGYVMVPGIGGSDDAHWQTLWERRWGDEIAVRIEPSSWSQPDLETGSHRSSRRRQPSNGG